MTDVTLLSVFLVGLLGGLHCAGMCGGIVAVMGAGASRPAGRTIPIRPAHAAPAWPVLLGYNAGRIASYVAAGTLAGALGSSAALVRTVLPVQQVAFVAANLVLIAMGLYLTGVLRSVAVLEVAGRGLWRALQPLAARALAARDFPRALAAGLVWGWVPCGMVYGVLVAALVSGSAADGALLLLVFGLGTLPNLLALGFAAQRGAQLLASRGARLAAGVAIVLFGLAGLSRIDPLEHLHAAVDACVTWFQ